MKQLVISFPSLFSSHHFRPFFFRWFFCPPPTTPLPPAQPKNQPAKNHTYRSPRRHRATVLSCNLAAATLRSAPPLPRIRSCISRRRSGQTRPSWITRIRMMGAWRWPWICYGDDGAGSAPAASGWRPATNPSLAVSIGIQPLLSVLGQGVWGCLLRRWTSTRRHLQHLPPVGLQDLYAQGTPPPPSFPLPTKTAAC